MLPTLKIPIVKFLNLQIDMFSKFKVIEHISVFTNNGFIGNLNSSKVEVIDIEVCKYLKIIDFRKVSL